MKREVFKKVGPPFAGGPLSPVELVPLKIDPSLYLNISANSQTQYFAVQYFLCPTWRKSLILETFGLLTGDLSVLLVYPCAVTTGLKLLFRPSVCFGSVLKRFISRENLECLGMFFSSYERCLNSQANIWVRFAKNSPLYRLNY